MKLIFHLDLDSFFVSVERILNPELEGKPVIVGGDPTKRGVVAACSYEAREYGIHSAMPIRQAFKLCPHGVYLSGHSREYSNYSNVVENELKKYSPQILKASIDEFYLEIVNHQECIFFPLNIASSIQKTIYNKYLLPCSIGIGSHKTIAKIGSDFKKPLGITYILPGMEKYFLAPMPIETIPGIGDVSTRILNEKGFYNIHQLANNSSGYFEEFLGKAGKDIWRKANGEGNSSLENSQERKSLSKEITFENDLDDKEEIEKHLFDICCKLSHEMRKNKITASSVTLKLRYSDFRTITRSRQLKPINDEILIYETVLKQFRNVFSGKVRIRLIGVNLSNLNENIEQILLFNDLIFKRSKLTEAIEKVRARYGYKVINFSS